MSMSISYEETGRTRQKARTREAILSAAREMLGGGTIPTVEQAADSAGVSRATAYRYFPNQRDLLVASYAWIEEPSLVAPDAEDVKARLASAVDEITAHVAEEEAALRAMLRLSLEGRDPQDLVLRQGRRLNWVREALAPIRDTLREAEFERLATAIATGIGIEAFVWLTDVAGKTSEEAVALMRWSASALLEGSLER